MNILGLFAEGPNPAACLIQDGVTVALAEEERFVLSKTAKGCYPANAAMYCLQHAGLSLEDVDCIAFAWDATKYESSDGESFMSRFYGSIGEVYSKDQVTLRSEQRILARFSPDRIRKNVYAMFPRANGKCCLPEIRFVPHHLAHAASAFYASGFHTSSILTVDGSGEDCAAVLWSGDGTSIREVSTIRLPHSLGWFYAGFTEYLGLRPYMDEGKVMGLAPYGREDCNTKEILEDIVRIGSHGELTVDPYYTFFGSHTHGTRFTDKLVARLGPPRRVGAQFTPGDAAIAYGVQSRLQESIDALICSLYEATGQTRLCISGGVAMNAKMNGNIGLLRERGIVSDLFVQPVSSDAGTAMGAAMIVSSEEGANPRFSMTTAYLGPEYSDKAIFEVLRAAGVPFERAASPSKVAAELVARGKVVGWFQGRMEAGPRALGNRSLLADPRLEVSKHRVNNLVKHREEWRPFAPSVLSMASEEFFGDSIDAPFMIRCYEASHSAREQIAATVHVDGSTRPQIVDEASNPRYWALLEAFRRLTGVPAILNTSLNDSGVPIVCSPADALACFMRTSMDAIVLGSYVVIRR